VPAEGGQMSRGTYCTDLVARRATKAAA